MDVRTYRARTMQDALSLVRRELGPHAAVLHTRDVRAGGLYRLLPGMRQVEVTASADVTVPSRMPRRKTETELAAIATGLDLTAATVRFSGKPRLPAADEQDHRREFRDSLKGQLNNLQAMVEDLCRRPANRAAARHPASAVSPVHRSDRGRRQRRTRP